MYIRTNQSELTRMVNKNGFPVSRSWIRSRFRPPRVNHIYAQRYRYHYGYKLKRIRYYEKKQVPDVDLVWSIRNSQKCLMALTGCDTWLYRIFDFRKKKKENSKNEKKNGKFPKRKKMKNSVPWCG